MYLVKQPIKETVSAEFSHHNFSYVATINGKRYKLDDFLSRAKKDSEIASVIDAIENKMKLMKFKGDVSDFIKKYFSSDNPKPDVMIKNGTTGLLHNKEPYAIFDDDEIAQAKKYDEDVMSTAISQTTDAPPNTRIRKPDDEIETVNLTK